MTNREMLLGKALSLFAARGYDAVGVQEIVESAGVTKPTLYHYFGSKQGLLESLLEEQFAGMEKRVGPFLQYSGDVKNTLEKIVKEYFMFAREQTAFYRLVLGLWLAPPGSEAFRAVDRYLISQQERMEAVFLAAAKDHGNMSGRHKAYAATFLGMINTYIGLSLNGYGELNDGSVYQAVHQFMHGIFS
jgi:AcrR family transcriptional regulator